MNKGLKPNGKQKPIIISFLEVTEKEDRDIIMRRAYEKISELLDILKVFPWEGKR